ncbi:MAG: glycoside hydrolase family 3 C-terminal domain-containing protein [Myxococcota bacterium]
MPQAWHYRRARLRKLCRRGHVDVEDLRRATRRVLRARAAHGVLRHYERPTVSTAAHHQLALDSACASIIVARNQCGILPLKSTQRIGVVGPLGSVASLGSEGSASVAPPFSISPLEGLREVCRNVSHEPRTSAKVVGRFARRVDVVVVVFGSRPRDEGEYFPLLGGGDRKSLSIRSAEVNALLAAVDSGRPTVAVWVGGGLPALGAWETRVPCIVFAGHGGMQGGLALARVLTGQAVASGHLTACVPREGDDLPPFNPDAKHVVYDRWFDYRRYDRIQRQPLFNVGSGSAQTTLHTEEARIVSDAIGPNEDIEVRVRVRNTGPCPAEPLLTIFTGHARNDDTRELRSLRGFAKARIEPGDVRELTARVRPHDLAVYDPSSGCWRIDRQAHRVWHSVCGSTPELLGEVEIRS